MIQAQNILMRAGKSNKTPPNLFGQNQVLQVLQHLVSAAHFQPPSKLQPWLQKILAEYDYPGSAGKCHGWPADQPFATNAAGWNNCLSSTWRVSWPWCVAARVSNHTDIHVCAPLLVCWWRCTCVLPAVESDKTTDSCVF